MGAPRIFDVAVNGVIPAPGTVVTNFGAVALLPNTYVRLEWLYYSAVTAGIVQLFFATAVGATADNVEFIADETTNELQLARFCYPVPPVGSVPQSLVIIRTAAGNARVRGAWSIQEMP